MTPLEKAARQALEALEGTTDFIRDDHHVWAAVTALREALEQPSQDAEDAARYRWLRTNAIGAFRTNNGNGPVSVYHLSKIPALPGIPEETDAAIDAARTAGEKQ